MIRIRRERNESVIVRAIHKAAFATDAEARLIDRLHTDGDICLSLIAEEEGEAVGNAILSAMNVEADGKPFQAAALGPIGVLPEHQKQGVGSALMTAAVDWARKEGFAAMFLLGDPRFYARFGFSIEAARPFASPYAGPHWQALILDERFMLPKSGRADYARAFAAIEDE